jgi:hypothetical protein
MNDKLFENFRFHSCIGIDFALDGDKKFVTKVANTDMNRRQFTASGDNTLIHKMTRCLWKTSEDGKYIEPVFPTDVLTADECETEEDG